MGGLGGSEGLEYSEGQLDPEGLGGLKCLEDSKGPEGSGYNLTNISKVWKGDGIESCNKASESNDALPQK